MKQVKFINKIVKNNNKKEEKCNFYMYIYNEGKNYKVYYLLHR